VYNAPADNYGIAARPMATLQIAGGRYDLAVAPEEQELGVRAKQNSTAFPARKNRSFRSFGFEASNRFRPYPAHKTILSRQAYSHDGAAANVVRLNLYNPEIQSCRIKGSHCNHRKPPV
jgi:hypothetical protein